VINSVWYRVKENIKLTFVAREPAVSLSRNTGIAKGPKVGVAFKAPLRRIKKLNERAYYEMRSYIQKRHPQVVGTDSVRIIRRWTKSNGEVAKNDIKQGLVVKVIHLQSIIFEP
jgi:hypothetical protein